MTESERIKVLLIVLGHTAVGLGWLLQNYNSVKSRTAFCICLYSTVLPLILAMRSNVSLFEEAGYRSSYEMYYISHCDSNRIVLEAGYWVLNAKFCHLLTRVIQFHSYWTIALSGSIQTGMQPTLCISDLVTKGYWMQCRYRWKVFCSSIVVQSLKYAVLPLMAYIYHRYGSFNSTLTLWPHLGS